MPTDDVGACTRRVNPHSTGCMGKISLMQGGNFSPDDNYVLASLNFTGAPAAPNTANSYLGVQLIMVNTDGTNSSTGDPWKCVMCGVPGKQQSGQYVLKRLRSDFRRRPTRDGWNQYHQM